jgi:hypothetical protein
MILPGKNRRVVAGIYRQDFSQVEVIDISNGYVGLDLNLACSIGNIASVLFVSKTEQDVRYLKQKGPWVIFTQGLLQGRSARPAE